MAEVTKEDVESMRNALESNGGKEYNAKIGGREFNYLVVPRNLGPGELPNFAMQKFSDDLSSYVIGVSDNLHQSYRPFVAFHEFVEFSETNRSDPYRCVRSLEEEIKHVPDEIKPGYYEMRKQFFEQLINYFESQKNPDYEKTEEFRKSLNRLDDFVGK